MEAGFLLGNKSKAKHNKKDIGDSCKKAEPLLSDLARKVRNIEGKMLGKDGKPLHPIRFVVHPMVVETMNSTRAVQIGGCNDVDVVNTSEPAVLKSTFDLVNYNIGFADPNMENVFNDLLGSSSNTNAGHNAGSLGNTSQHVRKSTVAIPMDAIDEINSRFVNTLYGFLVGKRLAFPMVENFVKHAWAKFGLKRAMLHHGSFLFEFESQTSMEKVLESGPWRIQLVPLILKEWKPNTLIKKETVSKVPLWVKMHNVPILAYSKGQSEYARALVEVSAEVPLIDSIDIDIPREDRKGYTMVSIHIEYEWQPSRCGTCKIFDHLEVVCPMKPKAGPIKKSERKSNVMKDTRPVHTTGNKNKGKQPQDENYVASNIEQSSDSTKKPSPSDSSKEGMSTFVNDDISLAELRNFVEKSANEESMLEYVGNNDINGCTSREEQGDKDSTKKPSSSMEVLNEDSDTDVEEVFLPNDETTFPSSSGGGGQQLEEDDYDAYEDQFEEYPGLFQEFCDQFDFKVKGIGRK
uniref:DUF4283 domain-containing protein n=1 Tax=Tanacetum cinerariifolium TaxID=118510 RepID=A0A6L2NIA6_TANCI|nr:hypothetical protein [Tanacetum cinerariifolium]